jgi:hypothetical protein
MVNDSLRKATGLIPASFVGISDLDSSPVILAITDSVATGNRARLRKETLWLAAIGTTMVVPITDAWEA